MKSFANAAARDAQHAVTLAQQGKRDGHAVSFAGGGSDLITLVKERLVSPDVVVKLPAVRKGEEIGMAAGGATTIAAETTLDTLAAHAAIRKTYAVLAEAAGTVATPQIRNVATLAGNVCQRPWCWYFRNGFPCLKNGGTTCYSVTGENQFHAIFGGGPSYIVHPSDTAPALVALEAAFRITGPAGTRTVQAADFFTLPRTDAARENVLAPDEVLAGFVLPRLQPGTRSTYHKIMDREAWTHAVVSVAVVLEMEPGNPGNNANNAVCKSARVVLGGVAPIPWRLPEVEKLLAGQRITPELAARAGDQAVVGARPLEKNAYKIPLTKGVVKRTLLDLVKA
jgi:xanthine dehydrogenase YagS FAD-binding subunit